MDIERVRLRDVRHFTATQLIGAGVDARTVAGRLGHSDPSLTLLGYSHVIEERDRAAAQIMGQVLSPPAPQLPRSHARKPKRTKVDVRFTEELSSRMSTSGTRDAPNPYESE